MVAGRARRAGARPGRRRRRAVRSPRRWRCSGGAARGGRPARRAVAGPLARSPDPLVLVVRVPSGVPLVAGQVVHSSWVSSVSSMAPHDAGRWRPLQAASPKLAAVRSCSRSGAKPGVQLRVVRFRPDAELVGGIGGRDARGPRPLPGPPRCVRLDSVTSTGECQSIRARTLTGRDQGAQLTSGWGAPQNDTQDRASPEPPASQSRLPRFVPLSSRAETA